MIPVICLIFIFLVNPVWGQTVSFLKKETGVDLSGMSGHPLPAVRRGISEARQALTDYYWSIQYLRPEGSGAHLLCNAFVDSLGEVKVAQNSGPGLVRQDSLEGSRRLRYFFSREQTDPVKVLTSRQDSAGLFLTRLLPETSQTSRCEFFPDGSGRVVLMDGRLLIYEMNWQASRFGMVRTRSRSGVWSEEPFVW